jgi:2-octaprenyl-6-methoxyphenol hydroxylase
MNIKPTPSAAASPWHIAIVGAGPVGLSLALLLARRCPTLKITVIDARSWEHDVSTDARTLALSLGSIQTLQSLGVWDHCVQNHRTQAITHIHVSQAQPGHANQRAQPSAAVHIHASDVGTQQLGAVIKYGHLVQALQQAWAIQQACEPHRLHNAYGAAVKAITRSKEGIHPRAVIESEHHTAAFDLAVVAEGGVFQMQPTHTIATPQKSTLLNHSYQQTAWVGTVTLTGLAPGLAIERFTPEGPLALLPLPPSPTPADASQASLVWCVNSARDTIPAFTDSQRIEAINALLPEAAGRVQAISPLKSFALGLKVAPRLVESGCIVRLGNAAQTLHPVAGQGLNLGLRDVQCLVHQLRLATQRSYTLQKTLCQFQRQREPDRWGLIAVTDFLARNFTWPLPGISLLQGMAFDALERTPPLKQWLARKFMWGFR